MEYMKRASRKIGKVVGSGISKMSSKHKEPKFETVFYLPMSEADIKVLRKTKEILYELLVQKGTLSAANLDLLMHFCENPVEGKNSITHFGQLLVPREVLEEEFGMGKKLSPMIERACTMYQIQVKREELEQQESKERRKRRAAGSNDDTQSSESMSETSTNRCSLTHENRLSLTIPSPSDSGSGYEDDDDSDGDVVEGSKNARVVNTSSNSNIHRQKEEHKTSSKKSRKQTRNKSKSNDTYHREIDDGHESDIDESSECSGGYNSDDATLKTMNKSKSRRRMKKTYKKKKTTRKKVYGVAQDSDDENISLGNMTKY